MNYDSTQIGVPYVRVPRLSIDYTDNTKPKATIQQALAVKLADGSIRELEPVPEIIAAFDMLADGTKPIPLVDPTTGAPLGMNTTLQQVMLSILAVVRQEQKKVT